MYSSKHIDSGDHSGEPDFTGRVNSFFINNFLSHRQNIRVEFQRFSHEDLYDFLPLYDGSEVTSPQVARLTGSSVPAPLLTPSNQLLVDFFSDYSITFTGFQAKLSPTGE